MLEIQKDNEIDALLNAHARGEAREADQCEQCGGWTYLERCPECPGHPPVALFDRLLAREEAGETIDWEKDYDAVIGIDADGEGADGEY